MKKYFAFTFILLCCLLTCFGCGKRQGSSEQSIGSDSIRYAQGFHVTRFKEYIKVELRDPWDSTRLLHRYLLVERGKPVPKDLPAGTVVQIPIRNIVVYTSPHAAIVDLLGESHRIIGVCESRYMKIPSIQEGIRKGTIVDMGESTSPNVEMMISHKAEAVIASPFENGSYGPVEKMGIPIIEAADYMESTPLGRAEWIRLYGLLLGKEQMADSIFQQTEKHYLAMKALAANVKTKPTVFAEKKFGDAWFIAGGDSYMAQFFKDAGASYVFSYVPGSGSTAMQYENVYEKAVHADFWLIKYDDEKEMTYDGLRAEYKPYANFDAFAKKHIYGCNTMYNHYYEEFPIHPDRLLQDLILIFHSDLIPGAKMSYYKSVSE